MTRWGIVATIKAPLPEIMRFAAHHLELGAHRLYLYLDDADTNKAAALSAHPKIRVTCCDDAYWHSRNGRPGKHQVRQTANATHAYARKAEVDWIAHIDVDEFLWPSIPLDQILDAVSDEISVLRLRPSELLAGGDRAYKSYVPPGPDRLNIVQRLYGDYAPFLNAGFLSHIAGKTFLRTGGLADQWRIHRAFKEGQALTAESECPEIRLLHWHCENGADWNSKLNFRLRRGSYRAELRPTFQGTLNTLLSELSPSERSDFFETVVADTPDHRRRLAAEKLLFECDLDLNRKVGRHFGAS